MAATPPSRPGFSISQLALLVPWIALVIGAWGPIGDSSFLWHVRAGSLQASSGSVITMDPFSFTMGGEAWLTQSWLIELLYGWAESLVGLGFVAVMILLISTLTFFAVGLVAFQHSNSVPATAFILILTTLIVISFSVPRPVIFSYLLLAGVVLAWERPSTRWTVPFLLWVFAAVHASFVIALAYIGLTILMRRDWRALPIAILSGVATLATAHGLGVIEFLTNFNENRQALQFISEWRRPTLLSPLFIPFVGGSVFIIIGAARRRIRAQHAWLLIPFLALGVSSIRAVPPAWIVLVPLVAVSLSDLGIGMKKRLRPRLATVFAGVVLMMPFLVAKPGGVLDDSFPVAALSELDETPTFHNDRVGGYLIWAAGPERRVYIDDRAELYGWRMEEFVKVREGDADWREVFERDGIAQVLMRSDEPLLNDLAAAGWLVSYKDESYTVMAPASG